MFLRTLTALVAFASPIAVFAQDATWPVHCVNQICESQMIASRPDSKDAVASVKITSKDGDPAIGFAVSLPLGVALEPGVQIVANDTTIALPFKVCLPAGCTAFTNLSAQARGALESVDSFQIRFFVQSDPGAKAVELPTTGLTKVLDRLSQ